MVKEYLYYKHLYYKTGKIRFDDVEIDKDTIKEWFKIIYHYENTDDVAQCSFFDDRWVLFNFAKLYHKEYDNGYIEPECCPDEKFYEYDLARYNYLNKLFYGFWNKIDKWHAARDITERIKIEIEDMYIEKGIELDDIEEEMIGDIPEQLEKYTRMYDEELKKQRELDKQGKEYNRFIRLDKEFKNNKSLLEELRYNGLKYEPLVKNAIAHFKTYIERYNEKELPLFLSTKYIDEKVDKILEHKEEFLEDIEEHSAIRFNSQHEKVLYEKLCNKFGKENILKEYNSPKYPWNCDFYIKNKDLFIEYQGTWSHFGCPYEGKLNQKLKLIKLLEKPTKSKNRYMNAIKDWTITDSAKRKWAKNHKLNWIEFFNMEEMNNWIENYT